MFLSLSLPPFHSLKKEMGKMSFGDILIYISASYLIMCVANQMLKGEGRPVLSKF